MQLTWGYQGLVTGNEMEAAPVGQEAAVLGRAFGQHHTSGERVKSQNWASVQLPCNAGFLYVKLLYQQSDNGGQHLIPPGTTVISEQTALFAVIPWGWL